MKLSGEAIEYKLARSISLEFRSYIHAALVCEETELEAGKEKISMDAANLRQAVI